MQGSLGAVVGYQVEANDQTIPSCKGRQFHQLFAIRETTGRGPSRWQHLNSFVAVKVTPYQSIALSHRVADFSRMRGSVLRLIGGVGGVELRAEA